MPDAVRGRPHTDVGTDMTNVTPPDPAFRPDGLPGPSQDPPGMDEEWFRDWISRSTWKFASTMADSPHWYTNRRNADQDEFNRVVDEIRRHGWDLRFKGYIYRVYEIDGYIYWPMGYGGTSTPTQMQFLINRTIYPSPTAGVRISTDMTNATPPDPTLRTDGLPRPSQEPPSMDETWLRSFIASAEWVFAKTMPQSPHWYTLRRTNDEQAFEHAVLDIRAYGYTRRYQGYDYTSYDIDGYYYWTMGAPLGETILINRARLDSGAEAVHP